MDTPKLENKAEMDEKRKVELFDKNIIIDKQLKTMNHMDDIIQARDKFIVDLQAKIGSKQDTVNVEYVKEFSGIEVGSKFKMSKVNAKMMKEKGLIRILR